MVDLPEPDGPRVARFVSNLRAVWPDLDAQSRLGLAVSGGPDSVAMLIMAAASIPDRIEVATVDHSLRSESRGEAQAVAALCAALDIEHRTITVEVAPGNVQAQARAARYDALADWADERSLAALATAHHADDQAETLMMRLNRASGVSGLAGARGRGLVPGSNLGLVRPLLGWRREELVSVVRDAGVNAAQDPSNADDRFDRARMRKQLAASDWLDVGAVAASAAHLGDADIAIEWAARREWEEAVTREPMGLTYRPRAPRAIALRVLARMVRELSGEDPRGSTISGVFDALLSGKPASVGDLVARPLGKDWTLQRAPRRRSKTK